MRQKK